MVSKAAVSQADDMKREDTCIGSGILSNFEDAFVEDKGPIKYYAMQHKAAGPATF
jgi:hypothetical protein